MQSIQFTAGPYLVASSCIMLPPSSASLAHFVTCGLKAVPMCCSGGLIKDPVVEAIKSAAGKHDETTTAAVDMANPSAPPTTVAATASGESQTLLYGAAVDVNIKKVPVVTMSDAPCKNICKDTCRIEFTQSCSTVPVVTKVSISLACTCLVLMQLLGYGC